MSQVSFDMRDEDFSEEYEERVTSSDDDSGLDLLAEDISLIARQSELEAIDNRTNNFIRKLLANTRKNFDRKNDTSKIKVMHGRSLYGFPTLENLEKHNEVAA